MTKTKTTISKKKKSTKKLNFKNFFIFTIIFATLVASLPNLFSTDKSASAIENEAYCTSSACRAAKKAENEAVAKANEASKEKWNACNRKSACMRLELKLTRLKLKTLN